MGPVIRLPGSACPRQPHCTRPARRPRPAQRTNQPTNFMESDRMNRTDRGRSRHAGVFAGLLGMVSLTVTVAVAPPARADGGILGDIGQVTSYVGTIQKLYGWS